MSLKENKENLEAVSKIIAFVLALSYGLGFLFWNIHLSSYGYFEYDLLQTRFIFSGLITIIFFAPPGLVVKKLLEKNAYFYYKVAFLIVMLLGTVVLFSGIVFSRIPQHFGGARPFPKSIIADPDEIEFLSNFNIPSVENADGKRSVQTNLICEIYSNRDLMIIGTVGESGSTLRILNFKKDKIRGFQVVAPFEEGKYRERVCTKFFYRIFK